MKTPAADENSNGEPQPTVGLFAGMSVAAESEPTDEVDADTTETNSENAPSGMFSGMDVKVPE